MALLLPPLIYMFAAGVDYARIFHYAAVVANCARNGAIYASRSPYDPSSPYSSVQQAALADATNLNPQPTVSSTTGTDPDGNPYAEVTVTYTFQTVSTWGVVPASTDITRTVRMNIAVDTPQ